MANKMWAGRFSKELDERVNDFNSSVSFDARMYKQDIRGSIAHAKMLGDTGIIDKGESEKIVEGLTGILNDIDSGALLIDPNAEDIHMFVEQVLTERLGDTGKRLHTARSRNDQVALDIRMYLRDEILEIISMTRELTETLCTIAEDNLDAVMPGYTHLQRAQPITFAHHLMAYANMLVRDLGRLADTYKRMNVMPLGSGALASTTYPIDRRQVSAMLGFDDITQNSLDGVSDRDFCIELGSALSILMMHLSRFSEEIVMWCSWEFKFIELDDAYSTGSSIMPQKKNPDITELIRGKTGRVYGDLNTLLVMMKGLPLAYNKDMQEDKEVTFDAIETVKNCLTLFDGMLSTIKFRKDVMEESAVKGFTNATDAADYLVGKGVPFRDAHGIIGELVLYCLEKNSSIDDLSLEELKAISPVFEADVYEAICLGTCVGKRLTVGAPGREAMEKVIKMNREFLDHLWFDEKRS